MLASGACGLAVLILCLRYRRRREGEATPHVQPSLRFELLSIGMPLTLFLGWWVIGYRDYLRLQTPPADAIDVYVARSEEQAHRAAPARSPPCTSPPAGRCACSSLRAT